MNERYFELAEENKKLREENKRFRIALEKLRPECNGVAKEALDGKNEKR